MKKGERIKKRRELIFFLMYYNVLILPEDL